MIKIILSLVVLGYSFQSKAAMVNLLEDAYDRGAYKTFSLTVQEYLGVVPVNPDNLDHQKFAALMLAAGQSTLILPTDGTAKTQFIANVKQLITVTWAASPKNHAYSLIKALWHVNKMLDGQTFPASYADLFSDPRSADTGRAILKKIADKTRPSQKHAAYLLSKISVTPTEDDDDDLLVPTADPSNSESIKYWVLAAQLGHVDAQVGVPSNWKDEDQFFDSAECWWCIPNCQDAESCDQKLRACCGCGPSAFLKGGVGINCCLCGISTTHNCESMAKYLTSGCFSTLHAIELPLKIMGLLVSAAVTVVAAAGGPVLPIAAAGTGIAACLAGARKIEDEAKPTAPGAGSAPTAVQPIN
ncbi:MAG: hypothetical protein WCG05_00840 [Alphaproteobacteria bacterium]